MSTPALVFRPELNGVHVDLDQLVASRLLIQANSGGGKSRMLRYILEQTHGRIQQIILDPEGEFASLREKFDYLLAGREGDVPAEPKTAKVLCRRLLELGASAVIDLYDLKLDERRRFVRLFLEELMHLPRALWRPLLVVIDEAHVFSPERGQGEAESTQAVITLCTQGRKRGYACLLATQRISKLHKDAAAELLNKLIGRTGLDVDMKRAGDELGFDKETRLTLRDLEPGNFYAFGPAIARSVTLVRGGPITTTHPQPGKIAPPAPPAPAAVKKLVSQMQDLQKQSEQEARTEAELREQLGKANRRVREVERLLNSQSAIKQPAAVQNQVAVQKQIDAAIAQERKRAEGVIQEHYRAQTSLTKKMRGQIAELGNRISKIGGHLQRAVELAQLPIEEMAAAAKPNGNGVAQNVAPRVAKPLPVAKTRAHAEPRQPSEGVTKAQQKILDALAAYEALGDDSADRASVAAFAGMKQGGHFNNSVSSLRTAGLIDYPSEGQLALTDQGRDNADAIELESLDDVHALWYQKRTALQATILEVLIEIYPESIERADLAERIGKAEGGHFNNTVSSLRTLGALDYPTKGSVRASERLFPKALT